MKHVVSLIAKPKPNPRVHVRWMIRRDMPEILEIERECFWGDAWSEDTFLSHLRNRTVVGMVAEVDDSVGGYMVYNLLPQRIAVWNFAAQPALWRRGVGMAMTDKLKCKLSVHRRSAIDVIVRDTNDTAHLFFRSQGFRCTSIERGAFADGQDGYRFEYRAGGFA